MEPPSKNSLQKPPGYRDPNMTPGARPRPMPPRKPVLPPSFQGRKKRRSCCRFCCCCCCITLLMLMLFALLAGAVFYLWYDPRLPTFHLQSFRVPQFNVTVRPDGSFLTSQTVTRIEVKNPSGKLTYYYGDTEVDVSAGKGDDETSLGSGKVASFKQTPKNATSLKVETQLRNQMVDDRIAKKLTANFQGKQMVVNVAASTKVGFGVGGIKVGMLGINLKCEGITMNQLDSAMPKCSVNTLKWINLR